MAETRNNLLLTRVRVYKNYAALEADFVAGNLHPSDLKPAVTNYINKLLDPVRQHFAKNEYARNLLQQVMQFKKEEQEKKKAAEKKEEVAKSQ